MTTFKLKTISPNGPSVAEVDETKKAIEEAFERGYKDGFLAGQSDAVEAHLADQSNLTSELIEALHDAALTNEAARRHVLASVAPMIETIVRAVLPALAEVGVAGEAARLVMRAIEASPGARPRILCAPEVAERLRDEFAARSVEADIEERATFLPREARIEWDQGADHINLDACIAEIRAVIASHIKPKNGDEAHERDTD